MCRANKVFEWMKCNEMLNEMWLLAQKRRCRVGKNSEGGGPERWVHEQLMDLPQGYQRGEGVFRAVN